MYAERLTKEDLVREGITEITTDCRIFKGNREVFPYWLPNKKAGDYLAIQVYRRDPEGHLIRGKNRIYKYTRKDGTQVEYTSWSAKPKSIGLHRAMWAWHYGEVPEGFVVDHINNKHNRLEDYRLDNLQLLTPRENVVKERKESDRQVKCRMDRPREYYENKLKFYSELYEQAKKEHNAEKAHSLRSNLAQTRARLRYWDAHKEEYDNYIKESDDMGRQKVIKTQDQKNLEIISYWKRVFRDCGNKGMWHECCKVERLWKKGELSELAKKHAIEVLLSLGGLK